MVAKHISEPLVPPKEILETIPEKLSDLIVEMMDKNPSNRPKISEVKERIQMIISERSQNDSIKRLEEKSKKSTTTSIRNALRKVFKS